MEKVKLTKAQKDIIGRMRNGWGLGRSTWFGNRTWIQDGGIGRGGESKNINRDTADTLESKGLIKRDENQNGYSYITFSLTELGKTIDIPESNTAQQ
jgi:hypothetical protein